MTLSARFQVSMLGGSRAIALDRINTRLNAHFTIGKPGPVSEKRYCSKSVVSKAGKYEAKHLVGPGGACAMILRLTRGRRKGANNKLGCHVGLRSGSFRGSVAARDGTPAAVWARVDSSGLGWR